MTSEKTCDHCRTRYWYSHARRKFYVHDVEDEEPEDARKVCGFDHEEAAERYAEEDDAFGDYAIVSGSEVIVEVRALADGSVKRFRVTGETVPAYHANELDEDEHDV